MMGVKHYCVMAKCNAIDPSACCVLYSIESVDVVIRRYKYKFVGPLLRRVRGYRVMLSSIRCFRVCMSESSYRV